MATRELITKVWIEDGCIVCDACETAAPTVFEVTEDTCIVRPEALKPDFTKPISQGIKDAAEECPVDVIKFETVTEEVAAGAPAAAPPAPSKPTEAPAPKTVKTAATAVDKTTAKPAKAKTSPAAPPSGVDEDEAITALLRAATTRGGRAGILKKNASVPESVRDVGRDRASPLPPDAKQAKVQQAARKLKEDPDRQRRSMLSGAALGLGWTAFGLGAGMTSTLGFARFMMPNVLEEPDPRVRVGKLQRYLEMEPGDVIEDFKPQGIWMIRDGERLAALSIICTHLGCIPNWIPNDRKFKCPCHGSGYRPNGINFEGPTPRPLERFRLLVEDGILVVDKSKKYHQELGQWDQPGSYIEV